MSLQGVSHSPTTGMLSFSMLRAQRRGQCFLHSANVFCQLDGYFETRLLPQGRRLLQYNASFFFFCFPLVCYFFKEAQKLDLFLLTGLGADASYI